MLKNFLDYANSKKNNEDGFTLIELVAVVTIIALLALIALPVFRGIVDKARDAGTKSNIRSAMAEVAGAKSETGAWAADADYVVNGTSLAASLNEGSAYNYINVQWPAGVAYRLNPTDLADQLKKDDIALYKSLDGSSVNLYARSPSGNIFCSRISKDSPQSFDQWDTPPPYLTHDSVAWVTEPLLSSYDCNGTNGDGSW